MSGKIKKLRNKIKSKIEVIKKINDTPVDGGELYDLYLDAKVDDLSKKFSSKKDALLGKFSKKKKDNQGDIFSSVIDIASTFLNDTNAKVESNDKLASKNKLKKYALQSADITVKDSKRIVNDAVREVLFVNTETSICGVETGFPSDTISISPKEFDFLEVLQVDPLSDLGTIMYEQPSPSVGKVKMNRDLYGAFSSPYTFSATNGKDLFDLNWNTASQEYDVSGLKQGLSALKVGEFTKDYYSSIEGPNMDDIIRNTMLLTLKGGGDNPPIVDEALGFLTELCEKLFGLCGSPEESNLIQTTSKMFNENDADVESYFDFNDVEGIDVDDRETRLRKVLKFVDCGNFEVPTSTENFEDFVYLSTETNNLSELSDSILANAAANAALNSGSDVPPIQFQLELISGFILNLPKAIIGSIISPKYILPIVLAYKAVQNVTLDDVKDLMKKLSKLFFKIIKDVFWRFIQEFWKLIKRDLLAFVAEIAATILGKKYKRLIAILLSIISILRKILAKNFDNCLELFTTIIQAITSALNLKGPSINIPGIILSFSDILPGYSTDRAYMNAAERMAKAGLNTGEIYGEANELLAFGKALIDGNSEEIDNNSFIKAASKFVVIPTPLGPVPLPPGYISVAGKIF